MSGRRRLIVGGLLIWEVTSPLRIPIWWAILVHMLGVLHR